LLERPTGKTSCFQGNSATIKTEANNGLHRTSHKVRRPVSPDVGA